jgi:hypothetical protein
VYFRLLLIGFFEGIASQRGICWRVADSLSLRQFLNYSLSEATPDHVTMSRTRRWFDEAVHKEVFTFVLTEVARRGMLKGKTIGIDATTLEANAAMRSIVRRDTGQSYMEYLRQLAAEAGMDPNDDAAVRSMDRKREKKTSNGEWLNPHDPDAEVMKRKDGSTHLAYKAEQAVDLDTGAIVAIATQGGAVDDRKSIQETLPEAGLAVAGQIDTPADCGRNKARYKVHAQGLCDVVTDKGYHSEASFDAHDGVGREDVCSSSEKERKAGAIGSGQGQPTARGKGSRQGAAAQTWRVAGAALRASVRDRGDAPAACARPGQCGQASLVASRGLQSGADPAVDHPGGDTQRLGGPDPTGAFGLIARSGCSGG